MRSIIIQILNPAGARTGRIGADNIQIFLKLAISITPTGHFDFCLTNPYLYGYELIHS